MMKFLFDYKERDVDYNSFNYGMCFSASAFFMALVFLLDTLLFTIPAIALLVLGKYYHSKIKIKK